MVLYPRSVSNAVVATAPNRIEASDTDEWRESRTRNFHFLARSFAENEWSRGDGQVVVRRHLRSSKQESLRALRDFHCKSAELAPHWSLSVRDTLTQKVKLDPVFPGRPVPLCFAIASLSPTTIPSLGVWPQSKGPWMLLRAAVSTTTFLGNIHIRWNRSSSQER